MNILCVPVGPLQANCYLVWGEDRIAYAIDPGGEPERLARMVQKEDLDLRAILVTHGHFDHVDGVQGLAQATGAKVYCSSMVAPVLRGEEGCSATGYPIAPVSADSVMVVGDGTELSIGRLKVSVVATPGHTPGDLTFAIEGHLFPGDLIFYRSVGRTDFPGGDFRQLLESVAKLMALYPETTPVHPGHMQATTLGQEAAMNPFLGGLGSDE